ncbi:tetratricopeptide repeat protein [Paludisphaera soli]|uniref:tetratricopeptide repeat protein n=1 Tax=Paludisphaera soli TaxID=2712865 RepID=UPI0013EB7E91|nr:tetratricopeptide repeat protein [Paludisphaera soli]
MGLFDRLYGKAESPIPDPARLRDELFASVQSGDSRRLERLARANEAAVLAHFRSWQLVPEEIRADPSAVQAYVHSLVTIAQLFDVRLGHPELMAALTGPADGNPIEKWQSALRRSRELLAELRYDEARSILADSLIDSRGMTGTGVDSLLPITHGLLAEAYFHAGRAAEAVSHLEHALRCCERSGDSAGIAAYLGCLFEAHRYLGQAEKAAGFADRLAAVTLGKDASRWRTRARIVRAGEPLNRVVAVVDGVTGEVDEVRPTGDMRIQFVFERNRITLRPAVAATARGQELGAAGRYDEALAAFEEASAADPFDPHSRFLAAFSLLHLGRYAEAEAAYRSVEELAPGWFQCRADAWLAGELAASRLGRDDLAALTQIQDGTAPPERKLTLADRLLDRRPHLPPALLHRGKALAALGRPADARAALEAGLASDPEPDVKTRLLVDLAALTEDPAERAGLFREAIAVGGNLVAAASASVALRLG